MILPAVQGKKQVFSRLMLSFAFGLFGWYVSPTMVSAQHDNLPDGALVRLGDDRNSIQRDGVQDLAVSSNGKLIATRSVDQIVSIWEFETGVLLQTFEPYEEVRVDDLRFTADSQRLITLSSDDELEDPMRVWSVASGKCIQRLEFAGDFIENGSDGRYVVTRLKRQFEVDLDEPRKSLVRYLVTLRDQARCVANVPNQPVVLYYLPPPNNAPTRHAIIRHEMNNSSEKVLGGWFSQAIVDVACSPKNNEFIVACRGSGELYLRDLNDRRNMADLRGHRRDADIVDVEYSNDGRYYVSASSDGTARIWDAELHETVAVVEGHGDRLSAVTFSSDGKRLVTGSTGKQQNCAYVWDVRKAVFPPKLRRGVSPDRAWRDLASQQARLVYRAMNEFLGESEQAVEYFRGKLGDTIRRAKPEEMTALIERLGSNRYSVRNDAFEKLLPMRRLARELLEKKLEESISFEMRLQIGRLLADQRATTSLTLSESKRFNRMLQVLEVIDSSSSRSLISRIANGHPNRHTAAEAKQIVQRLSAE